MILRRHRRDHDRRDALPAVTAPPDAGVPAGGAVPSLDGTDIALLDRVLRWGRRLIKVAALPVLGLGVAGLLIGLWAFSGGSRLVVAAASLPAIVGPVLVLRWTSALARSAGSPRQVVDQFVDLLRTIPRSAVVGDAERLLGELRTRSGVGRLRGAVGLVRVAGGALDAVAPDPVRHPALVPLRPERLVRLWRSLVASMWGVVLSGVLIIVALAERVAG